MITDASFTEAGLECQAVGTGIMSFHRMKDSNVDRSLGTT